MSFVDIIEEKGEGAMSQHTPGPWTAEIISGRPHNLTRIANSKNEYIGELDESFYLYRSEYLPNARLIAKAPEMYAALQLVMEAIEVKNFTREKRLQDAQVIARALLREIELP